jgi:hypothetical protein
MREETSQIWHVFLQRRQKKKAHDKKNKVTEQLVRKISPPFNIAKIWETNRRNRKQGITENWDDNH